MYRLRLDARAEKDLQRVPTSVLRRLSEVLLDLRETPRPAGSLKLKGTANPTYRIRVGDYRVIYRVDDATQTVSIYRVLHRKDVYRGI